MTLEELAAEFRSQVSDELQPYLWSEDEVLRYIIDAQDMFARLTGGIADMSTAALVNITVTAATPFTDHSPYILRIMSGRLLTSKRDIEFVQESQIFTLKERDYGSYNGFTLDDSDTGLVKYGVLGLTDGKIRWLRVPLTTETCRLRIYRLPYPRVVDWDGALEIQVQHHMSLISWMKHRAYSKQDVETRDDKKAEDSRVAFQDYCKNLARGEIDRMRYKPRTTQFSW